MPKFQPTEGVRTMAEMNEEELHEKIEEYREEVLRFIPLRYTDERRRIQEAGSLKLISRGIDAFLKRTKPKKAVCVDPSTLHDGHSAQISVHRVFQKNLVPVRDRIEAELKDLVVIEDERE